MGEAIDSTQEIGNRFVPIKITPLFAWMLQGFGVVLFGGLFAGSLLVNNPSRFTYFEPIFQPIYVAFFVITIVLCLRPPGVILYGDEMVVRRFLRERHVERRNVREVLFQLPKRVIGGEMPRSKYRHVQVVIWDDGKEFVIPIVWSDYFLGLMTPQEAEAAKEKIETWAKAGRPAED